VREARRLEKSLPPVKPGLRICIYIIKNPPSRDKGKLYAEISWGESSNVEICFIIADSGTGLSR